LRRIGLALLILALLPFLAMEGLDRWMSTDRGARWLYRHAAGPVAVHRSPDGLRQVSVGDTALPPLVLLHGSPGGLFDYRPATRDTALLRRFRLIVPERPGYGATRPRGPEPSIRAQADRLLAALSGEARPLTVAGYSYGGPVAMAMAGRAPDRVAGVLGLAGQYDPDNEMVLSISPYLRFGFFRNVLPRWLWVSNEEKMTHRGALREVLPDFDAVRCGVWLVHGTDDAIVPTANSPWLAERLVREAGFARGSGLEPGTVRLELLEGKDHSIPFSEPELLIERLRALPVP
jgi:pimeloyl-ACP methyl ester carboxylesterase